MNESHECCNNYKVKKKQMTGEGNGVASLLKIKETILELRITNRIFYLNEFYINVGKDVYVGNE